MFASRSAYRSQECPASSVRVGRTHEPISADHLRYGNAQLPQWGDPASSLTQ